MGSHGLCHYNKHDSFVHTEQTVSSLVWGKWHLHVSGIAKVDSTLGGTFVAAILKTDHTLTSTHLFIGEVSNILFSFLGTNARLAIITRLTTKIKTHKITLS